MANIDTQGRASLCPCHARRFSTSKSFVGEILMGETLPQILMENEQHYVDQVALREKEFGIWQSITWREFAAHVRRFALGLRSLGFQTGDRVAIIGDNRPEWLYTELAAQALGGVS